MELNFKVFFCILSAVVAQNVTDYDYESSTVEEISTEMITELPKTTTLPTTLSEELPSENYWVCFVIIFRF